MTINRNKAKFAILIFWVVALLGALYGYLSAGLTLNELVELIQKIVQR